MTILKQCIIFAILVNIIAILAILVTNINAEITLSKIKLLMHSTIN